MTGMKKTACALLGAGLLSLAAATPAQAALFDFSGEITNPNSTIGAGNTGNLTGNGSFGWQTGTTGIDVITNGFTFMLDSGGGNAYTYNGSISGSGNVRFRNAPVGSGCCANAIMNVGGSVSNTYTGTSFVEQGIVRLQKSGGATAIAGDIVIGGQGANDKLMLGGNNQIADTSKLTFFGSAPATFDLNGFSETVAIVQATSNAVLATGSGGSLTTSAFNNNGTWLSAGTYNSADFGFITGTGSVTVLGGSAPPAGDKIGWQWVTFDGALSKTETAGLPGFEQNNWNTMGPRGQVNPTGTLPNLVDSNGFLTTVSVSYSAPIPGNPALSNSWELGGPNATPNGKLLNSYLGPQAVLTVSGIAQEFGTDGYSVIVYYNNDGGPGTSDITIDGITDDLITQRMITGGIANTRFEENGFILEEGLLNDQTNVMIFEGLNDLGFVLSLTFVSGNGNNGISGFQIIKNAAAPIVPEPTTMMLLSVASCGFAMMRRRRQGVTA